MKREFGEGYALINVAEFHPDKGSFIYPNKDGLETLWLDESTTHQYLNKEIATNVLNVVDLESCPDPPKTKPRAVRCYGVEIGVIGNRAIDWV